MQTIFGIAEDMFKKNKRFYIQNNNLMLEQAIDYLNKNSNEKALTLLDQNLILKPENNNANYGKAIGLARIGKYDEAITTLTDLIDKNPGHENGKILLKALKEKIANCIKQNDIVIA